MINQIRDIEGWLGDEEADLLIIATERILSEFQDKVNLVEVGSFCGRSNVATGKVI